MVDASHPLSGPLVSRVIEGWRDRRATTLRLIRHGRGESEALYFAVIAAALYFVAGIPAAINGVRLAEDGPVDIPGVVISWMLTSFVFMVLARYILSMLSRWGAKMIGGSGSHLGARYAQFWAALLTAPVLFLPGAVHLAALITVSETIYAFAQGMDIGAQLVFLIFWSQALSASEGFSDSWRAVFAIFAPLVLLGLGVWTVSLVVL